MQILSIRCGLTRNLGNFESAKLEVEASPSDGQTHVSLLEEVREYLEKAMPEGGAGSEGKKSAKKSTGKGKKSAAKKIDVTPADESKPPQEPTPLPTAHTEEPTPAEKATSAKPTKDEARFAFDSVMGSKTLEELLERFNKFRDPGLGYRYQDGGLLTKEEWAASINKVQDCYKSLTTADSDIDVMHDLVAAISGERNIAK